MSDSESPVPSAISMELPQMSLSEVACLSEDDLRQAINERRLCGASAEEIMSSLGFVVPQTLRGSGEIEKLARPQEIFRLLAEVRESIFPRKRIPLLQLLSQDTMVPPTHVDPTSGEAKPPESLHSLPEPTAKSPESDTVQRADTGGLFSKDDGRIIEGKGVQTTTLAPLSSPGVSFVPRALRAAVELLRNATSVMVLTGAGISVSCGIPDFRSENGLYSMMDEYSLPEPQMMFDIEYFRIDPNPFFKFAKKIYPGNYFPSKAHRFIRALKDKGKLLRNYTQNIDTLEQVAGIEPVIQCHGSFASATCTKCGHHVAGNEIKKDVMAGRIPYCTVCAPRNVNDDSGDEAELGVLKPDITFFGEKLPRAFEVALSEDKEKTDLLIVMGSSLKVRPVSSVPGLLSRDIPQILINRETVGGRHEFDIELLGDCEGIVDKICELLGWRLPDIELPKDVEEEERPTGTRRSARRSAASLKESGNEAPLLMPGRRNESVSDEKVSHHSLPEETAYPHRILFEGALLYGKSTTSQQADASPVSSVEDLGTKDSHPRASHSPPGMEQSSTNVPGMFVECSRIKDVVRVRSEDGTQNLNGVHSGIEGARPTLGLGSPRGSECIQGTGPDASHSSQRHVRLRDGGEISKPSKRPRTLSETDTGVVRDFSGEASKFDTGGMKLESGESRQYDYPDTTSPRTGMVEDATDVSAEDFTTSFGEATSVSASLGGITTPLIDGASARREGIAAPLEQAAIVSGLGTVPTPTEVSPLSVPSGPQPSMDFPKANTARVQPGLFISSPDCGETAERHPMDHQESPFDHML
eukprot:Rmarinus@m.25883